MKCNFIIILSLQILLIGSVFSQPPAQFNIEEATIDSLQQAILNHHVTCLQIVNSYLTRIKNYNLSIKDVAPINALTEINPSVLDEAQSIDEAFSTTQKLIGTLHVCLLY